VVKTVDKTFCLHFQRAPYAPHKDQHFILELRRPRQNVQMPQTAIAEHLGTQYSQNLRAKNSTKEAITCEKNKDEEFDLLYEL
jgi:hypothetical protein